MREHRGPIGSGLLAIAGAAFVGAAAVVAGHQADWTDGTVIGLLAAGGGCLLLSLAFFVWPDRPPKPERSPASQYSELFLREEGLWPKWWQRALHPGTPVRQLPIRVPPALRDTYRVIRDAIYEFIDELESNARDLTVQLEQGRVFAHQLPGSAWAKNRHLLNAGELAGARELVQDAYLRTHALNKEMLARFDAASHEEVNDPKWLKLSDEEVRERTESLEAVTKALTALRVVRDS